jgi:hypothetical protein
MHYVAHMITKCIVVETKKLKLNSCTYHVIFTTGLSLHLPNIFTIILNLSTYYIYNLPCERLLVTSPSWLLLKLS